MSQSNNSSFWTILDLEIIVFFPLRSNLDRPEVQEDVCRGLFLVFKLCLSLTTDMFS